MSEENVELVRASNEAFNRGDIEGMVANAAPDFEYVASGAVPGRTGVYRGREGFRRFLEWIFDEFDEPRAEFDEIIEAGDQVLVSFTLRGRGKQSGVAVDMSLFQLWTMREGKFARGQGFTNMDEARQAAGLQE